MGVLNPTHCVWCPPLGWWSWELEDKMSKPCRTSPLHGICISSWLRVSALLELPQWLQLMMNNHVEVQMNETPSSPGCLLSWCFITAMGTSSKTEDAADKQMSLVAVTIKLYKAVCTDYSALRRTSLSPGKVLSQSWNRYSLSPEEYSLEGGKAMEVIHPTEGGGRWRNDCQELSFDCHRSSISYTPHFTNQ